MLTFAISCAAAALSAGAVIAAMSQSRKIDRARNAISAELKAAIDESERRRSVRLNITEGKLEKTDKRLSESLRKAHNGINNLHQRVSRIEGWVSTPTVDEAIEQVNDAELWERKRQG